MISFRTLFAGLGASFLLSTAAQAQAPANDLCSTSQALTSGVIAQGTTLFATDDLIGLPGCQDAASDIHPDVWYTITATATQLDYTVTASAVPGAPLEVLVYEGDCAAGLTLLRFDCGTGTITGGIGALTIGTTYRIVVASPNANAATAFSIEARISAPPILPSQDCNQATILTSPATFSQGTINSGNGTNTTEVSPNNSCWLSGGERQSKWFKFVAGTTGKLVFNIRPNTSNDDYDWGVWDVTGDPTGCTTKGNTIACNWTGARGATGLSFCKLQEPGYIGGAAGDQFDNKTTGQTGANGPITIQAGRVYALLVDNFSTSNAGFQLIFGGACAPPAGQTVAQIGLDANFDTFIDCNSVVFSKRNPLTSTTGFSYLWNFGDGTSSTSPTPIHRYAGSPNGPTTYTATLQITDVFQRRTTRSLPVVIDRQVVASVVPSAPTAICTGDSLTLQARGGTTYVWSPATGLSSTTDSVVVASPSQTTIYTLTATSGSCTDTATYRVVVTPLPTTTAAAALTALCEGSSTTLTATGAERYEWSPATGLSSTTDATVTATPAATTTYTVTGYNGQCPVTASVTVTVTPFVPATITSSVPTAICAGDSVTLRARGGTAYVWSPADGLSSTTDSVVFASPSQTTTYTLIATSGSCIDTATYQVLVTPLPTTTAAAGLTAICLGSSTTLTATGAERYEWSPADGLSSTTDATVTATPAVTTTYTVTGYNGQCPVTASVTVTVTPFVPATITSSVPNPICAGESVTLTARGGATYAWSPATGLSSTTDSVVVASPSQTTTYTLIATSTTGVCVDTSTYLVEVTPQPATLATAAITDLCQGSSTTITATGAERYEWSPATGLSSTTDATVTATPTATTTYTVTGYNGRCSLTTNVTITVSPTALASGTISDDEGIAPHTTSFAATVADATTYAWDFGDGQTSTDANPTHTYANAGDYTVTLAAVYGAANCQTAVATIGTVTVTAPTVYNIITPNGDGMNETFSAPVSNEALQVKVFNRWGREVFSADNYQQNWNGGDLPAGTYYYHISVPSGKMWKGWLEIVR